MKIILKEFQVREDDDKTCQTYKHAKPTNVITTYFIFNYQLNNFEGCLCIEKLAPFWNKFSQSLNWIWNDKNKYMLLMIIAWINQVKTIVVNNANHIIIEWSSLQPVSPPAVQAIS